MIKKFFSNGIVIGVLVSVISTFIISAATALYKQVNILQGLKQVLQWIASSLSYKIQIYWVLLILIGWIIAKALINKSKKADKRNDREWLNYKRDHYKSWIFAWDYYLNQRYQYSMTNLHPICNCGCELSLKSSLGNTFYSSGVLLCPKCNTTYPALDEETMEDVKKIIDYNIKSGEYPKLTNEA